MNCQITADRNQTMAPTYISVTVKPATAWLAWVKERLLRPPNIRMSTAKKYPANGTAKFIPLPQLVRTQDKDRKPEQLVVRMRAGHRSSAVFNLSFSPLCRHCTERAQAKHYPTFP